MIHLIYLMVFTQFWTFKIIVKVWFTDQASKGLEIEDNFTLTLIIG